jgi:hypothetical protein
MRRTWAVGAIIAALAGCSTTGTGHGLSVSPSPPPDGSPSVAPVSPTENPSPGPDGPLEVGGATILLTGDLTLSVSLPTLAEPDVWSAPPAPMDLTWNEPGGQSLTLAGTSFVSRASTSNDHVLSFVVEQAGASLAFRSTAGECVVTITPALPDNVGGLFRCTGVTDGSGAFTVDATGTFTATT